LGFFFAGPGREARSAKALASAEVPPLSADRQARYQNNDLIERWGFCFGLGTRFGSATRQLQLTIVAGSVERKFSQEFIPRKFERRRTKSAAQPL